MNSIPLRATHSHQKVRQFVLWPKERKKKANENDSEDEEDDFTFDKLSKKDMFKVMKRIERIQEQIL